VTLPNQLEGSANGEEKEDNQIPGSEYRHII
jgi:hypothetical protein